MKKKANAKEKSVVANRIKKIRRGADLTQEEFAEALDISLSACKKIESGENQISIDVLRKVGNKFNVSLDYILLGERSSVDNAWEMVLNCTEKDKMVLMLRLLEYFVNVKEEKYLDRQEQKVVDEKIVKILEGLESKRNS